MVRTLPAPSVVLSAELIESTAGRGRTIRRMAEPGSDEELEGMKTLLSAMSADLREVPEPSWETEQAAVRTAEAALWIDRELERRG